MRSLTSRLLPLFLLLGLIGFTAAAPTVSYAADDNAAETTEDGKKDKGAPGPLNLVYGEAIWNLFIFLLVLAILAKFVFPAIRDGLKAREDKLEGDLTAAEKAKADADETLAAYKAQLAEAQKEAQQKIAEASQQAEQVAAQRRAETESEIAAMRERAANEIAAAKEQAIGEMHAHMAELSTQIAGRILKREINASDQQQLVSDSLSELTKSGV